MEKQLTKTAMPAVNAPKIKKANQNLSFRVKILLSISGIFFAKLFENKEFYERVMAEMARAMYYSLRNKKD